MVRNILALQQNLSNFVPLSQCSIMERARDYYLLYNLGSEVSSVKKSSKDITIDNSCIRELSNLFKKVDLNLHLMNTVLYLV